MVVYTLDLEPAVHLSDEQFYELCGLNPDLKLERTATGKLIIMPLTGGETGNYNAEINAEFVLWNRRTQRGKVFDSSTGFKLPGGGNRSPDVAWIEETSWNALSREQKRSFPAIAPDFVLELLSPTDSIERVQAKMREYIECGVKLGWLIDRDHRTVEIYRPNQAVEILREPQQLSGEEILPAFVLKTDILW